MRLDRIAVIVAALLLTPARTLSQTLPDQTFQYAGPAKITVRALPPSTPEARESALTFVSPSTGHTVEALLFQPRHVAGRHGAVLFVHGEDIKTLDAGEFKPDGIALAKKGITSLSIFAPWSRAHWYSRMRSPETDYVMSIDIVKDLRAALDALAGEPNVDPAELAFVGHDFGGMYGTIMSGIDRRPKYYVFIAETATLSEWYLLDRRQPADSAAYLGQMKLLDPVAYLPNSHAQAYLFQFADVDEYVPMEKAITVFNAAPTPRTMAVYHTGHTMQSAIVFADRMAWLLQRIH